MSTRSRVTRKNSKTYCMCKKPNDGSPMIHCASCKDWFHFRCVELSEKDAEEIQLYICPSCHQKTGARTIKEWEGPEAINEFHDDDTGSKKPSSPSSKRKSTKKRAEVKTEEPESDPSSEGSDEYDPAAETGPKRRTRRQAYNSDNDSVSQTSPRETSPKRLRRGSVPPKEPTPAKQASPAPSTQPKRKQSTSAQPQPPSKRPRSESTAGEDAVRKYCLGKLQELFCQIFTRYPFLQSQSNGESGGVLQPDKKTEDLTVEEKESLESRAKQFGTDLEQCMFELYSEPDKQGKHVAVGKYKERFRMLTFNLSKADRVVLHMRIASSRISPKELSTMSSTDLASEEEKQSIKKLEEEALAHSILKKSTVPRAKLTHKGLQDIEDVTGAGQREAEREREEEEEERIERERLARLRQQAQRAQSQGSAPPESPVVPQTPTWGGPPPVPSHAVATSAADSASPTSAVPIGRPLFVPSASDFAVPGSLENELNLADLINIDEEPSGEVAMTPVDTIPTPFGETPPLLSESHSDQTNQTTPSPITPSTTGISPFAAKGSQSDTSSRPSFDLNSLWTPAPSSSDVPMDAQPEPGPQDSSVPMSVEQTVETDFAAEAEDQDFDMFLNTNDQDAAEQSKPTETTEPTEPTPQVKELSFEDRPPVWTGMLSMPLDSAIPQEVAVIARQSGGRTLPTDSPLWQALFPSKELRIDGRVPVEKSAQYLTQVRLNPTKELIAAAFSSAPGIDSSGFHAVKNHLLSKGRHGLIFPWGHNPKSSAPGRELYVVPLLSTDPIPEYMELLDQLQLPQSRNVDYLVGIWVLTKGKLNPPPHATATTAPVPAPAPPAIPPMPSATHAIPNIDFAQLQQLGMLPQPPQPSQPPPPPPPAHTYANPAPPAPAPPATTSAPSSSNLAADVTQLTPEQVQLMLQTLAKTSHSIAQPPPQPYAIPSTVPPSAMPVSQPVPSPQPIALPQAALQAWTGQPPGYSAPYPHQHQHQHQSPPPYAPYPGAPGAPSYGGPGEPQYGAERYDHERSYSNNSYNDYDRGGYRGRGGRGGRGGFDRDRDRGRGRGGWKARGRGNRGRGGGGWSGDQSR
ncbi:hypothetical protein GY45DRAFT_1269691 [Cubamyces sp. BRFM 1775]|nr:hypothetical protein GY45DRAFT_1269691 [Cubamyces sp. BRFM 1775]